MNSLVQQAAINNRTRTRRFVSLVIPIAALLIQYPYGIGSVGMTMALIVAGFCILSSVDATPGEGEIQRINPFFMFSIFYLLRMLINLLLYMGSSASIERAPIMTFLQKVAIAVIVLVLSNYIDEERLYKTWSVLGVFVVIGLVYHAILLYVLGRTVSIIPLLPLPGDSYIAEGRLSDWHRLVDRPIAFFTESEVTAFFLAPVLHFSITRKKYALAMMWSAAILLSTSTIGIITVAVLWLGALLLNQGMGMRGKLFIGVFCVALCAMLLFMPIFGSAFNKLISEINGTNGYNAYIRVWMGYDVFNQLTFSEKLFGCTDISTTALMHSGRVAIPSLLGTWLYGFVNMVQELLITTGYLGTALYAALFVSLYRRISAANKPFLLLEIAIMFGTKRFFNAFYIITYILILGMTKIPTESNEVSARQAE